MPMGSTGAAELPYDEVFTAAGTLRYPYVELGRRLGTDPLRPAASVWRQLRDRPFGDDNRILPIPWALYGGEYADVLMPAMSQRARALQMFFADIVQGPQRFLDAASLTRELLELILLSEGASLADLRGRWAGHEVEEIRFVYGPDLMRGPHGHWLVLEENVGCIGGSANGPMVWDRYVKATTPRSSGLASGEPDLRIALCRWLQRLGLRAGNPGVVGLMPAPDGDDVLHSPLFDESARRRLILEEAGISVTEPDRLQRVLCEDGADWPQAIFNIHSGSESGGGARGSELVEEAFRRHVALLSAPGTEILSNKALMPYVDDMIRFFLHEEPVITIPPTQVCQGGRVPTPQGDWVVKSACDSQGTGVFLTRGQPPARLAAIYEFVERSWPDRLFVAQQRVEPSRLSSTGSGSWDAYPVQLRVVTYVLGWSEVHVSTRPVGKAVWGFDIRRCHSTAQGACLVPMVVIAPEPRSRGPEAPGILPVPTRNHS